MKPFFLRYWYIILLSILGIAGGFLYWRHIGCATGSCPITSHWYSSTAVGTIMGYLTGSLIYDFRNKTGK